MANPFSVDVPNPLQALMAFDQSYDAGRKRQSELQMQAARMEAGRVFSSGGDPRSALAKLLSVGDVQGANALATFGNNQRDFSFRQQEAQRAQMNADRGYNLQARALDKKFETVVDQVEQRRAAAAKLGFEPSKPGYESFVLTGKMPREDQQPLTATDKKAIIEADEGVLAAETAIEGLKKAKEISPGAFAGPLAAERGYGMSLFGNEAGSKTVELENLITSNALTQLKSIFGGMPTEGERKILLEVQGSVKLPDEARQKIYDRAIVAANKRLEFNRQRAASMRGGTFYKPPGAPQRRGTDLQMNQQGISKEQYDALPPGTPYTAPDGSQRVKQ